MEKWVLAVGYSKERFNSAQKECLSYGAFIRMAAIAAAEGVTHQNISKSLQERELLNFAQEDKAYQKYYDEIVFLLETELRISELCGLTDTDLNFEKGFTNVDHQLLRSAEDSFSIETPKTDSGIRQVPMTAIASEAFKRVLKNRRGATKALQYIMGHANIVMTLNHYACANFDSAKAEMGRLDAGMDVAA